MPFSKFSSELQKAIKDMNFVSLTDVQQQALEPALKGDDIIVQAQTGSGKTLVFAIPILEKLNEERKVQAIVLTPTRELANQVTKEFEKLSKHKHAGIVSVYGGVSLENQVNEIRKGARVVVGTPGRIIDLIKRNALNLSSVRFAVLDEADRMLDMGFIDDVFFILSKLPKKRQTMMLSATVEGPVKKIAEKQMNNPISINVHKKQTGSTIDQFYVGTSPQTKFDYLCKVLKKEKPSLCLVFCNTKVNVSNVEKSLKKYGFSVDSMHGNMTQAARDKAMENFRKNNINILVVSDVAARGLDVNDVSLVINYDAPGDSDSYIHRIGRTGRIGKKGKAITLLTQKDMKIFERMKMVSKKSIEEYDIDREDQGHRLSRSDFRRDGRSSFGRSSGFRRGPPRRSPYRRR